MERRHFVAALGGGTLLAAPAIARAQPTVTWRLTSSFPRSLLGSAVFLTERVAALTDGGFRIIPFAAGEIVPPLQVLDAVQNGTVEIGQTEPHYHIGKDKAFAFGSGLPFGFNARQQQAWMLRGGGQPAMRALLKDFGATGYFAGNTGAAMGGWYRKEIATLDDIQGLKIRIAGLAGEVFSRMGAVPQQIGGGDLYAALENGTIDAAAWAGPRDDEALGLNKIAKYYYYPGWWSGNGQTWVIMNLDRFNGLPLSYRAALESACAETNTWTQARYDTENPAALRRLVANGAVLRPFSRDIMHAAYKTSFVLYEEIAAGNARFKAMYQSWKAFRAEEFMWFRAAEYQYENFVYAESVHDEP